jgi:hypothetical protein
MTETKKYLEEIQIIKRDYSNAVREAQVYKSDHLTPEGLRVKRGELVQRATAAYRSKLEPLKTNMDTESNWIKARAVRAVPPNTGGTRDNWERVKMLLDAGQSLQQVIAKADAGALHAIREWAPTWLDATSNGETTDLRLFERSLTQRWAEIVSDPAPIRDLLESASDIAQFGHMAASLTDQFEGRAPAFGSLEDAYAARLAGQMANANLDSLAEASQSHAGAA